LLSVDDEGAVEYFVAAMLGVHLRESKDFAVGEPALQLARKPFQISHFLIAQGEPFLLIVGGNVLNIENGFRSLLHREHFLVQAVIQFLEHGVEGRFRAGNGEEFLNPPDVSYVHILGNLYRGGAPWGDHLPPGSDKPALHSRFSTGNSSFKEPYKTLAVSIRKRRSGLNGKGVTL